MKNNYTLLLTGATGMIGGSLVRRILEHEAPCQMILPVRDIGKAEKLYEDLQDSDYQRLQFVEMQMEGIHLEQLHMPIDYIIHCACVTQSAQMVAHPIETADSIIMGTKAILELARKKQVKSMVYLSSMEVYGRMKDTDGLISEDQLGNIDLKEPRSCYPLGKRMAEHYCYIYCYEHKIPVKIARLAQTFGKGVRLADSRVYMQFAHAVHESRDIVLKTRGMSMGNYCALDDAVEGILTILHKGKNGEAYNVVNESNTMRIGEMAKLVAEKVAKGRIGVRVEGEDAVKNGYAPDTDLRLSGRKLRELGWEPKKGLEDMYREVLEAIKEVI